MKQHIGYAIIVSVLAFMSWATGTAAQATHGYVELGFYALFITMLAVVVIIWFCETFKPFRSSIITIKGERY